MLSVIWLFFLFYLFTFTNIPVIFFLSCVRACVRVCVMVRLDQWYKLWCCQLFFLLSTRGRCSPCCRLSVAFLVRTVFFVFDIALLFQLHCCRVSTCSTTIFWCLTGNGLLEWVFTRLALVFRQSEDKYSRERCPVMVALAFTFFVQNECVKSQKGWFGSHLTTEVATLLLKVERMVRDNWLTPINDDSKYMKQTLFSHSLYRFSFIIFLASYLLWIYKKDLQRNVNLPLNTLLSLCWAATGGTQEEETEPPQQHFTFAFSTAAPKVMMALHVCTHTHRD